MANVAGGKITWDLDADTSKFDAGLKHASQSAASFSKSLDTVSSTVAKGGKTSFASFSKNVVGSMATARAAIARFAVKATKYVGLAGIAATTFAVKGAADMQMLRTSLDTLTGSADQGSQTFRELNKYAAATPYQTKELARAANTMLAFGINAEDTMKALRTLGDVANGNSERMQGLALAYAQVQSTGRLMGQDLLQMVNQGFNPLQIISEKTGKSMATLKKEMENGAISAEMVSEAFKTATSEGGRFYNGALRGSKTLGGVLSTLSDIVQMAAFQMVGLSETGDVLKGGLYDKILTASNSLIQVIDRNKESIIAFGSAIVNTVSGAMGAALPTMEQTRAAFASIQEWISYARVEMVKLQPYADFLGAQLSMLWDTIQNRLVPSLKNLWEQLSPILVPVIKYLAEVIGATLGVALSLTISAVDILARSFSRWIDQVALAVKTVKDLVDWIGKLKLPDWLGGGTLKESVSSFTKKVPFFAGGVSNFSGGLAVVGERGPELVNLPRGSDVIPMTNASSTARQGATITNNIVMNRMTDIDALNRRMSFQAAVL